MIGNKLTVIFRSIHSFILVKALANKILNFKLPCYSAALRLDSMFLTPSVHFDVSLITVFSAPTIDCYRVAKVVAPKKEALRAAEAELAVAMEVYKMICAIHLLCK